MSQRLQNRYSPPSMVWLQRCRHNVSESIACSSAASARRSSCQRPSLGNSLLYFLRPCKLTARPGVTDTHWTLLLLLLMLSAARESRARCHAAVMRLGVQVLPQCLHRGTRVVLTPSDEVGSAFALTHEKLSLKGQEGSVLPCHLSSLSACQTLRRAREVFSYHMKHLCVQQCQWPHPSPLSRLLAASSAKQVASASHHLVSSTSPTH